MIQKNKIKNDKKVLLRKIKLSSIKILIFKA